ncbi:MAG: glutamate-5-semialdehyde dehydrogenase [Pirellulaceae bacterium]
MTALTPASTPHDLVAYCNQVARDAHDASRILATLSTEIKNRWLIQSAEDLLQSVDAIVAANEIDIQAAPQFGLSAAAIDRLRLDETRISGMAEALRQIASLPDPIGETIEGSVRPNGLEIRKVRVPLGTVFFIYESRPNVTVDAAAICVKSGNAVILRGGKEARHSSLALVNVLKEVAVRLALPAAAVQLVETTDRAAVGHFLSLDQWIDVAIPRGGKGLIERVVQEARMPVIKHFDGNCHVYVDASAAPEMARAIVINSKCQRMGVCNACESLLIHAAVAPSLLPAIAASLIERGVTIRGDDRTCQLVAEAKKASEEDWETEYLGPTISCRVVDSIEVAIQHINHYGSHHTDAIVTADLAAAATFQSQVDSAAVIVNASTRFNDGGEFGLGAEIGISTDKFHARGPCGLRELTTYKYLVTGNGQTR